MSQRRTIIIVIIVFLFFLFAVGKIHIEFCGESALSGLNLEKESKDDIGLYIIDLQRQEYQKINFEGLVTSATDNHIDISFWQSQEGERIAEVVVDPRSEEVEFRFCKKDFFSDSCLILYDIKSKSMYCPINSNYGRWLRYLVKTDAQNQKIKIIRNSCDS